GPGLRPAASDRWLSGVAQFIGVFGSKALAMGCGQQSGVTTDEGERMPCQNEAIAQCNRELHRIVGLERMVLGQVCCCHIVIRHQWNDSVALDQVTGETLIFAHALCPTDPADPLEDSQPCRDFHTGHLGYQDEMLSVHASGGLRVEQLADPGTPW